MRFALRLVLSTLAVLAFIWLASLASVLVAGSRPVLREADAIIVLGAAQYNGRPSPVFQARLDHALELYRKGYAPLLIVTGGVGVGDTISEGEVGRKYVVQRDVPASAILVDRQGMTSSESVSAAAALMRERDLHTALIVSDSYHMLRLQLLARRAGIETYRAPTPSSPIDRSQEMRRRYVLRESVLFPITAVLGAF
ncbi:MAG: YdcF family protein [Longimicrobiales bacterium]